MAEVSDPSWKFEQPQVVENIQWISDLQRLQDLHPRARQEWVLAVSRCLLRQPRKGTHQEKRKIQGDKVWSSSRGNRIDPLSRILRSFGQRIFSWKRLGDDRSPCQLQEGSLNIYWPTVCDL